MSIAKNLECIQTRVNHAALRAGRDPKDILLLAVTKTQTLEAISQVIEAGYLSLGENRVQELMEKYDQFGQEIQWHLIGHLQTNKVKYIADKVSMIHSVDSLKLAEEIDRQAKKFGRVVPILLEINMAGEESKFGISPKDCESLLRQIAKLPSVLVKGFMTVAPFVEDPEQNRMVFRNMKELLVDMNSKKIDNVSMNVLSMGMSGDFEVAIEEGATIVRVGTSIFGERNGR